MNEKQTPSSLRNRGGKRKAPALHTLGEIETEFGRTNVLVCRYPAGGALAVLLESAEDGESIATFSVNMRPYGHEVQDGDFIAKTYAENESLVAPMLASGWFEDTGRSVPCGFARAPVWRLRDAQTVLRALS